MNTTTQKAFYFFIAVLLNAMAYTPLYAQANWSTLWTTPSNPANVTYVTSGNGTVATMSSYIAWSTLVYTYPTAVSAGNGTMQVGLVGNFSGKVMYVSLTDNTGKNTQIDVAALLSIPYSPTVTAATATGNYSIDWTQIKKEQAFDLTHISKINFLIYDNANASSSSSLPSNSQLLLTTPVFGTGTSGVSTVLNPTLNQEWSLESSGYLFNANNHGVIVGSPTTNNVTGLLSYPYYNFIVNGRSNFIGNDNVIGIWSATVPTNGYRHYLGISNTTFPSTTTEYSTINAYEWNSTLANGNPKHLTLQNFNDPNKVGNMGVGYFTTAPKEKLSVNGNLLLTTPDPSFSGLQKTVKLSTENFTTDALGTHPAFTSINSVEVNPVNSTVTGYNPIILQNYAVSSSNLGSVGIGYHANPPAEKLSVNGNIRCKQLIGTQLGWSDYVFAASYRLRPLSEVKAYVQAQHHLPNIPSEKEIIENGLNVNNMLQLQMEKIEELTLYLIQQEEQIKALQKQLDALAK